MHVPAEAGLKLVTFGNETLLFHSVTGDTLLISPAAEPLIKRLLQGALQKDTLFQHVADELNFEVDESFLSYMDEVLSDLVNRDIVAIQ